MATVLNRTSLELIESVNTPDYSTQDWVINPDLSPVSGVPVKYWKLAGDVLSEMSQAEKDTQDATDLPTLKQTRYAEIDARTDELIAAGFTYASKQFSLSLASQNKMMGTHQVKDDPALTYPVEWNTIDDTDSYSIADAADLDAFYLQALGTVRAHLDSGTSLKNSIRAAADTAAVDAVVDSR
jgi:hypothetical protein